MKKLIAGAFVAVFLAGGATVATATPGPHGPNNFGLCTAWAANENGRENGNAGNAPPFKALQDTAAEDGYETVEDWCAEFGQQPGRRP